MVAIPVPLVQVGFICGKSKTMESSCWRILCFVYIQLKQKSSCRGGLETALMVNTSSGFNSDQKF